MLGTIINLIFNDSQAQSTTVFDGVVPSPILTNLMTFRYINSRRFPHP